MDRYGFVRENRLANKQVIRQDREQREEARKITMLEIYSDEMWKTFYNTGVELQTNIVLSNYQTRADLINTIVSDSMENRLNGIVIDFREINNAQNFERFIIELTPRLREIGIAVGVYFEEEAANMELIRQVVDFIVK